MATESQRPEGREGAISLLNAAINALHLTKEVSVITGAEGAFDSVNVLLTMIKVSMVNEVGYVELGLACAEVCKTLDRRTNRRWMDQPSQPVLRAIERFTMTVAEIQRNIIKRGRRNSISRLFHRKSDNEAIANWMEDLSRVLRVFNTELEINIPVTVSDIRQNVANTDSITSDVHHSTINAGPVIPYVLRDVSHTHTIVPDIYRDTSKSGEGTGGQNSATHASAPGKPPPAPSKNTHGPVPNIHRDIVRVGAIISDVHHDIVDTHTMVRNMLKSQEGTGGQSRVTQHGTQGELPPPPPRIFFGRDELIEKIVSSAECLMPIALIGPGGIGKTSTALKVLHDDRVKRRFGEDRRFVRCDKFPASLPHFLRRLSKAIGAGIENPEDLAPLRPFLSSKVMFIVLDNAESVLDPRGTSAQEIYAVVEELSQLSNICLCITSRISTVPPDCEWLEIPTLSTKAASDTFYRIYKHDKRSDVVTSILKQLDFHALSVTLLATVAHHHKWDTDRLAREWSEHRTDMLHTEYNKSLAATIELSLSSLMFQELGPDARELLEVVAFFPHGVDENNVDWLFPTIAGRKNIFDKFCVLSLTYRNDGFITMLAPIRDHLSPKDPMSTPLLCSAKERYFSRLSVAAGPGKPGFEEARWIRLEDVNVEHLLDVFTTIDATSDGVWGACSDFMRHLSWYKRRLITLGPKIEALPDDHPYKLKCLYHLSRSFRAVGNHAKCKRLLTHTMKLSQERGDDHQLARTLRQLSYTHSFIFLYKGGIQYAKEASEISKRLGDTVEQSRCLAGLAWLLNSDKQLDAAEEAALQAIDLLPEKGEQFHVSGGHHVLGMIYCSKGDTEKAFHHFEIALGIASSFSWPILLSWIHLSMALLFSNGDRFEDAHAHVEHAKLHAVNDRSTYLLARAMSLQARFWYRQGRFEEARSEALSAVDEFEKLGALNDAEDVRELLRCIDRDTRRSGRSGCPSSIV